MKDFKADNFNQKITSSEADHEVINILNDISKNIFLISQPSQSENKPKEETISKENNKIIQSSNKEPLLKSKSLLPVTKEPPKPPILNDVEIKKSLSLLPLSLEHELGIINVADTPNKAEIVKASKPKAKTLPKILADRYKLERILGVGGMCVVYRAYDVLAKHFGNPSPYVALKTFTEEFAEYPDANYLLYSEYALTAKLCHLNIVSVYQFDVDAATERAFITLELLKGITLEQWLTENPLGAIWKYAKPMILPLLKIIEYSHQQGILHGDLKPSNIMLTDDGLKLFDYGLGQAIKGDIAKLPKISRARFNAWTPRYAAPELLDGSSLTQKTDIFALCCIIYEMLSGKNPYFKDNTRKITNSPKKPKTLPKAAWKALACGLSLAPEKRTITISELLNAFMKPSRFGLF